MMLFRAPTSAVLLSLVIAATAMARGPAQALVPASAEPMQFYVFSFTDTPAEEAAQDIVGGALAHELTVDPAVDGVVSFRTEGWSGSDGLLNDFGTALLDQDMALIRTAPGAYTLLPRANVPMMLARGGVLMSLQQPAIASPPPQAATTVPEMGQQSDRWWDSAMTALLIFFAGTLAGGAALWGGQTIFRRAGERDRPALLPLQLTARRGLTDWSGDSARADPDLIIPQFDAPVEDRPSVRPPHA